MCRHVAYTGPTMAVAPVLTGFDHCLRKQAYQARELQDGQTVNADGFGFAWYDPDVRPEPARYADPLPIWADADLEGIGELVRSPTFLAAVRNASVPGSNAAANCAPFVDGAWSFSLNGYLRDFAAVWRDHVASELVAPGRRARVGGTTDSEWVFQALLSRIDAGDDVPAAMKGLVSDLLARAAAVGSGVQLNLLLSDGVHVWATRAGNRSQCNTLYHVADPDDAPGGHLVASEPLMDDPAWAPVDEGTLLIVQAGAPAIRMRL